MQHHKLATLLLVTLLTSCGGGSSSVTPAPTPTASPIPTCIMSVEGCLMPMAYQQRRTTLANGYNAHPAYVNQPALARIRADQAYANLALAQGTSVQPGDGVTVAVVDSGIDLAHPAFIGKTIPEIFIDTTDEINTFSHGTAVASVIAARRADDSPIMHGLAWGAELRMYAIDTRGVVPEFYRQISLMSLSNSDVGIATLFNTVLSDSPNIINLSIGFDGLIENYSETDLRANFGRTIVTMAQKDDLDKTIIVWAAGNSNGDLCEPGSSNCNGNDRRTRLGNPAGRLNASSASILSGLQARIPELQGHVLAVVAVDEAGVISNFSNRCGIAANWCLAAPGENIQAAFFGRLISSRPDIIVRGFRPIDGTSFSAPLVSGGLALMKQLFRSQLSSTELVSRLLATANKSGRYADRSIYGQGLLDLGAATSPVGELMITSNRHTQVDNGGTRLQNSQFQLGSAFGNQLINVLKGQQIATFDSLGAPFWFELNNLIATDTPRLDSQMNGFLSLQANHQGKLRPRMAGHLAIADYAASLNWHMSPKLTAMTFATDSTTPTPRALGVVVSWHLPKLPFSLRGGWLSERQTLLGGYTDGAFGKLASELNFIGLEAAWSLGRWQLFADAELGVTAPNLQAELITDISQLITSTFSLKMSRPLAKYSTLHLSLEQPIKIERGQTTLSVPVGRTKEGRILHQDINAKIVPSGRQIDVSTAWHKSFKNSELRLGTVWSYQRGHDTNANASMSFLAGWRSRF